MLVYVICNLFGHVIAFWYLFEPETLLALSVKTTKPPDVHEICKTHKRTTFARDLQGYRRIGYTSKLGISLNWVYIIISLSICMYLKIGFILKLRYIFDIHPHWSIDPFPAWEYHVT